MRWWRNLSKGKRWAICMTLAFLPLVILGACTEFAGYDPHSWVLIPVVVMATAFSAWAYAIRIS